MPKGDVETYFHGTEWHNRIEGEEAPFHTSDTRERAVAAGKEEAKARKVEHLVHNQDGTVGERESYGNDPRDVKG
nr:hypothetical protein [Aeromicrobium sp.]